MFCHVIGKPRYCFEGVKDHGREMGGFNVAAPQCYSGSHRGDARRKSEEFAIRVDTEATRSRRRREEDEKEEKSVEYSTQAETYCRTRLIPAGTSFNITQDGAARAGVLLSEA